MRSIDKRIIITLLLIVGATSAVIGAVVSIYTLPIPSDKEQASNGEQKHQLATITKTRAFPLAAPARSRSSLVATQSLGSSTKQTDLRTKNKLDRVQLSFKFTIAPTNTAAVSSAAYTTPTIQVKPSNSMNQTTNSSISSSALPSNVNGHHAVTNNLFNVGHDGTSGLHPLVQPGELIHSCQQPGSWALTFDDGPSDMTSALLDTLSLRHVKATFFVVSDSLRQGDRPEVLRRAYNEGHQIALHSRTHAHLADLPHEQVYAEIKDNLDDVAAIIGAHPRYFRCPYGECGGSVLDVLHELGLIPIQWNVDTKDFEAGHTGDDTLQVVHLAIMVANGELDLNTASAQLGSIGELGSGLENGAIQLQHDTIPESIRITDAIIDIVTTANFRPMTVAECINDSNGAYTL